jgi:toxin ParE1/3/4
MKISWSPLSKRKLREIGDYIALENPMAAALLIEDIDARAKSLEYLPNQGRIVHSSKNRTVRELVIRKNYVLLYETSPQGTSILSVRHSKQVNPNPKF